MGLRACTYHTTHLPPVMVEVPNAYQLGTYDHRVFQEVYGPPDIRCGRCSGGENDCMGPTYMCDDCWEFEQAQAEDRDDMEWEANNG